MQAETAIAAIAVAMRAIWELVYGEKCTKIHELQHKTAIACGTILIGVAVRPC